MSVQFFCPRWGSEDISWEAFFHHIKDAGYDGVEWAIGNQVPLAEYDRVFNAGARLAVPIIAQHYETADADFATHYKNYNSWLKKIHSYPVLKVNSQTGKDYFSFEENRQLIALAASFGKQMNKPVLHETHRGKFSFAAHVTTKYLTAISELQLTFDISHWMNVAESYLDDQPDALQMAADRAGHIHARIGYPEGPQVSDPRAREWEMALDKHIYWWDRIVTRCCAQGRAISITPEFGPFPYMVHDPATGAPLADQWEVNLYMMELLKRRYG